MSGGRTATARLLLVLVASAAATNFDTLAEHYGVLSRVKLHTPPGKERGLFVTKPVKAGEPVLAVPFSLCLVSLAEAKEMALTSPWDAPHHDAKDTLLARQLLAAMHDDSDNGIVSEEQRSFWKVWKGMLPAPGTTAHPLLLPESLLPELQDEALVHAARLQRARVDAVLGSPPAGDVEGGDRLARDTRWAVAMCSSRPFSIPLTVSGAGVGLAAFVPFVDMANHADDPNCDVQGVGDGDGSDLASTFSVVGLVANRDLEVGDEIFISYFDAAPNSHIFSRFGFVLPSSNRHDRLGLTGHLAPLSGAAFRETTRAAAGKWDDDRPLLEAALLSLPLTREASLGGQAEVAAAAGVEAWLREVADREFATSLEEDEAAMAELISSASRKGNQDEGNGDELAAGDAESLRSVRMCILGYRIQRKRLWRMALDVLAMHQATHATGAE